MTTMTTARYVALLYFCVFNTLTHDLIYSLNYYLIYITYTQGDLVCYQRGDTESVPGCSGTGEDGKDYCCNRTEKYLFRIGNDLGSDSYSLCEGDCDNDGDCKGELLCFQRSEFTKVPGCDGEGRRSNDYCVVSLTEEPTTSPNPQVSLHHPSFRK